MRENIPTFQMKSLQLDILNCMQYASLLSRTRDYTQLNNIKVDVVEMEQRIHHASPSAQHLNSAETSLTPPKPETVITNEHSCYLQ